MMMMMMYLEQRQARLHDGRSHDASLHDNSRHDARLHDDRHRNACLHDDRHRDAHLLTAMCVYLALKQLRVFGQFDGSLYISKFP